MSSSLITANFLRSRYSLVSGSEVRLTAGHQLTAGARRLLAEQQVTVKWIDHAGRLYVGDEDAGKASRRVHPLNTEATQAMENICPSCHHGIEKKPALMTHLNGSQLVYKNHPRIFLRGKIDALTASFIVLQHELATLTDNPFYQRCSNDLRAYLGEMLKAEVLEQPMPSLTMAGWSEDEIHRASHQPEKYIGHDHIVPEFAHGRLVALINQVRAESREVELIAVQSYITAENTLTRDDIVAGLNRFSSALYFLMLMTLVYQNGDTTIFKRLEKR